MGSAVDAALADGLADINAVIAQLEAQVENIASGEDVDAINETLGGVEQDLADLLASNNVFTGDLVINSDATLEFAESIKDKVAIINGSVTILAQTSMDPAKLKDVANRIKTITGDLTVVAASSSAPAVVFDSLSGVGDLKIAQSESMKFTSLVSAKAIVFGNNFESKVTGEISFPKLTTVTSFETATIASDGTLTGSAANSISLSKATTINLASLPYYSKRNLTIVSKRGSALDITALKTTDAGGTERDYVISLTGPTSLDSSGITKGTLTLTDVETVNLPAYTGKITVNSGVKNITMGALANDFVGSSATDLLNLDLTADAADKKIDLTGAANLIDAKIAGKIKTVTFSGNGDLEKLSISAALQSLTINASNLSEAILDHTNSNLVKDAALVITGNNNLASLTADKVDGLNTLTITNNPELERISLAALKAVPTGGAGVSVTIGGSGTDKNAFNATSIDTSNKSINTDSGLEGLKTFITEAAKIAGSALKIYFDSAEEYDGNAVNYKISVAADVAKLILVDKASSSSAGKSKRSFLVDPVPAAGAISYNVNGNASSTAATTNATTASYLAALTAPSVVNEISTYGATLSTSPYGKPEAVAAFTVAGTATITGITSATTMGTAQSVTLQVNQKDKTDAEYIATIYLSTAAISDLSAKNIGSSGKTHVSALLVTNSTTVSDVIAALSAAFPSTNGKDDGAYTVTVSSTATSATLDIAAKDKSPKYHGRGVKMTASASLGFGDVTINKTTTLDDTMLGTLPVVTFESNLEGDSVDDGGLSTIGNPGDTAGTGPGQLTFAGTELTKVESGDQLPNSSPDYVNYGVEPVSGSSTNRVSWL